MLDFDDENDRQLFARYVYQDVTMARLKMSEIKKLARYYGSTAKSRSVRAAANALAEAYMSHAARRSNPPYSGYDANYPRRKHPKDPTKIAYQAKRDALNVFIDWNQPLIDDVFNGPSQKHPYDSFDNFNHLYGLKGKRRVDTFAKALWWAMPAGKPYYLEDIDVHLLNETSPIRHNASGQLLTIPDYAEERRLVEQEMQYLQDKYDIYGENDEAPF